MTQPPPQALRFSHRRGKRETRVTGDEPQGYRRLSPSRLPLRAHFHRERETSRYEAGDDTYLFVTNMSFCYLEVISSLYVNFRMKYRKDSQIIRTRR